MSAENSPYVPVDSKSKDTIREKIFTRFDKPLGIEQYRWNALVISLDTLAVVYMTYLFLTFQHPWSEAFLFELPYGYVAGLGVTVGAHRYWTHKSFKANLPLQIFLAIMQTVAFQWPIFKWSLDHRLHHKYLDTDADPHNVKRGFWYSQLLWLCQPKTELHQEKLKVMDMRDLENDPVVRFQSRWYWTLALFFHVLIPICITRNIWGLPWGTCLLCCFWRHGISFHVVGLVNSVAHTWGSRPYDKTKSAVENKWVSMFALGEGWHNYHHSFPWDYRASEFGWDKNLSTMLIDLFAYIGWAWDLKTVSPNTFKERVLRTGDGSRKVALLKEAVQIETGQFENHQYWGWNDNTIPTEWKNLITIVLHERKKP